MVKTKKENVLVCGGCSVRYIHASVQSPKGMQARQWLKKFGAVEDFWVTFVVCSRHK